MSLPTELRDQLLTGYLDDALSADERTRVEQLLQTDDDFVRELAQLRQLSSSLKALAQDDSHIKLDPGFADRVLGAAVAQARAEGLDDDHPLVRLAEQPSTARRKERSSAWRVPAALIGLAASIAIAVVAWRSGPETGSEDPIAESQSPGPGALAQNTGQQKPVPLEAVTQDVIAQSQDVGPRSDDVRSDPDVPLVPTVNPESIASSDLTPARAVDDSVTEDSIVPSMNQVDSAPPVESIAVADNNDDSEMLLGGSPMLVYSVSLTALGRQSDAIRMALRAAAIDATSERMVTDKIAGFVDREVASGDDQSDVSVLFLQAPLKSLDQFYLNLMADEEGIESVGMTISFNAPIAKFAGSLRVDPKTVRHDGRLLELVSDVGAVDQLATQLGQLPFDFRRNRELVKPVQSNGPDEMGQVLVLVK